MKRLISSFIEFFFSIAMNFAKKVSLNEKERRAKNKFFEEIFNQLVRIKRIQTKELFVVALVGEIASGKSTIAQKIAEKIDAVVIESDAVRVALRKNECGYEKTHEIMRIALREVLRFGINVVLDSDWSPIAKRGFLRSIIREIKRELRPEFGIRVFYVQTVADVDVVSGRAVNTEYPEDILFGGAVCKWDGPNKGNAVAVKEMRRLTPRHYKFKQIGQWGSGYYILTPKKFPFVDFVINTNNEKICGIDIERALNEILKNY